MNRRTANILMWWISIVYGVTVGLMFILASSSVAVTVAWVGAIAVGLGWTLARALTRRVSSS